MQIEGIRDNTKNYIVICLNNLGPYKNGIYIFDNIYTCKEYTTGSEAHYLYLKAKNKKDIIRIYCNSNEEIINNTLNRISNQIMEGNNIIRITGDKQQ
jgi:hypothetical protein